MLLENQLISRRRGLGVFFAATLACGCGGTGSTSCPNDLPTQCAAAAPSYAASVQAVLTRACASGCHEPGGVAAGKRLDTYADVYRQRSAILNQAYSCAMPPTGSTPLTAEGRALLLGWLVCGAPNN